MKYYEHGIIEGDDMIEYKQGDLLAENAEALVNTVNCVGVMGRGIALQFKKTFPDNFKAYAAACKHNEVAPGKMFVYYTEKLQYPRYLINFPTKRHWKGKSKMEDIEAGLEALAREILSKKIHSIAIPPLGSGLGGLNWNEVRAKIEKILSPLKDVRIIIFEPDQNPSADTKPISNKRPNLTHGRATLICLINSYLSALMDTEISLLEIHKLMYFMQISGEPLKLKFEKAPYGPYAENLRHVLKLIEGHYITGYGDGGDVPDKSITLVPGAFNQAEQILKNMPETHDRFNQVNDLIAGFETPFGLELLSTVHWITANETNDPDKLIDSVYAWNERKKMFSKRQINIALETLSKKHWL